MIDTRKNAKTQVPPLVDYSNLPIFEIDAHQDYLASLSKPRRIELPAAIRRLLRSPAAAPARGNETSCSADRGQLKTFVLAMFKHASSGNWVSLRAFPDDRDGPPFKITPVKLNGNLNLLADKACHDAELAANARDKIVFAPPIATFNNRKHAREQDLNEGLALSVECDARARQARVKLEKLLGPPTVVVESGGEWIDPVTGEVEPKLHLHYRLKTPARGSDDHAKLKLARKLAAQIVGGDPSNVPMVHPIRWPGSVHRKKAPKLCRIIALNANAEIDLAASLEALRKAAPAANKFEKERNWAEEYGAEQGEKPNWDELIGGVLSGESYHEPVVRLAAKLITSGMDDRAAGNILRGLMQASAGRRDKRWQARYNDIDRSVSTAREKFGKSRRSHKRRRASPSTCGHNRRCRHCRRGCCRP